VTGCWLGASGAQAANTAGEPLVVETRAGRVRGAKSGGAIAFRGIPYGAPTGGESRFAAPRRPAPWSHILDALQEGPACPQPAQGLIGGSVRNPLGEKLTELFGGKLDTSEDCLRLNVFTPALDAGRRPVMVWIHGGYYTTGSGNGPIYDGSALAAGEDVVVVSVTHRLNVFGYAFLKEVASQAFPHQANPGHLDLVLALQWVRDNIARFGGDPGNVTIFGQSGGGRKCCVLMAMPQAKGLFHKAIIQSGPAVTVASRRYGTELAAALLDRLDIPAAEAQRLRAVPVEILLEAHDAVVASELGRRTHPHNLIGGFTPVADGHVVAGDPFEPSASTLAAEIPVLIGTAHDEQALFLNLLSEPVRARTLDEMALRGRAAQLAGPAADALIAAYRRAAPTATPTDLLVALETGASYWRNSLIVAERKSAQAAAVFMYRFDWKSPAFEGRFGACHGLDVPFVFQKAEVGQGLIGDSPEAPVLARQVGGAWAAFARTGSPQTAHIPHWPPYSDASRSTMIIDRTWRMDTDPYADIRRLWAGASA
jgi:para-nitrobenzyl esterase